MKFKSDKFHAYAKEYFYCCKYIAVAKILARFYAKESAINFFSKVFKKAVFNEFPIYVAESSLHLRNYYGIKKGNLDKFNFYNEHYKMAQRDWLAENKAQEYYGLLMIPYAKEKANKNDIHRQAAQFHKELQQYEDEVKSPFFFFLLFYIEVILHMCIGEYEKTIEVCKKAINYFQAKPYVYHTALSAFYHNQLACLTQLRRFEEAEKITRESSNFLIPGSHNWYRNKELILILSFHSRAYQAGYEAFRSAKAHTGFCFLAPTIKETWLIYEAYIYFLISLGKIKPHQDFHSRQFRINKFLNCVPIFSQDRRGLNIPILILQILFMIIRKDYEKAANRIRAIEKYNTRHVRGKELLRSNIFIKMLILVLNQGFYKEGVIRKAGKYIKKLREHPLHITKQAHEIEILPYEHIWRLILESLDSRKSYENVTMNFSYNSKELIFSA